MRRIVLVSAAVLLTAGCASTTTSATPPVLSPPAATPSPTPSQAPSATPSPTGSTASPQPSGGSRISMSREAGSLPPGMFKITPVKCGPYTPAEQAKFGTRAAGGLIFKFANASNTYTGHPKLSVNFLQGTEVAGHNVNGSGADIGPGQSAQAAVDALGPSGDNLAFDTCELMTYGTVDNPAVSFAPRP